MHPVCECLFDDFMMCVQKEGFFGRVLGKCNPPADLFNNCMQIEVLLIYHRLKNK